ncbi:MAG: hypothetical protein HYV45_00270 [Candidatus Moranbacteria bacterium]|nr:hypothetical protein [Candidatus Moranbacteria bacterium]
MIDSSIIIIVTALYLLVLFAVAFFFERKHAQGKNYTDNAFIYVLALAIYCTTWTYYGNVGLATSNGYLFLGVYLGPTLFFIFWAHIIKRILRLKREYNITSLAELISIRYGKSAGVAALVTIIAVIGIVPYLALQIKAISSSFAYLTTGSGVGRVDTSLGIILLSVIILFTIVFGFRKLDQTERHPGVIMAIAVQSVVKLLAFLVVGAFIVYFVYDGFGDIFSRVSQSGSFFSQQKANAPSYSLFLAHILLSMSAIIFLPRQFQVTVIENVREKHLDIASWLLPIYFALILLFVFPLAMAAMLQGYDIKAADLFMLMLANEEGGQWLAILVFIGGVSAALGMITFETIALTTMTSNHLLLPFLERVKIFGFLRQHLLSLRWMIVTIILFVAFIFERAIGSSYLLVKIGMISFAAVFQFVPSVIGGIYWKKGSRAGALLGMTGGFLVWLYMSVLPAFVKSGWLSGTILTDGPFGVRFLRPEHLFNITALDPLAMVVLFSFGVNASLYVIGSLLFPQNKNEDDATEELVRIMEKRQAAYVPAISQEANIGVAEKKEILTNIFGRYLDRDEAKRLSQSCFEKSGLEEKEIMFVHELVTLRGTAEKILATYIGTPAANEALKTGGLFTEEDTKNLSSVYVQMAERLKLTPEEFSQKIDYYTEKEKLFSEQKEELEKKVRERTKKMEEANIELKKINDVAIGRELKMIELKKKIHELEEKTSLS